MKLTTETNVISHHNKIMTMKNRKEILSILLVFSSIGFFTTDNLKSEEVLSEDLLWCHTAWIPNNGSFIKRCVYCDILLNKKGGNSTSTCPPTAN